MINILSLVNSVHNPPASLPKIHSNLILTSTPRSFKWSLSLGISHHNPVHFSPLSCPPHSPWFDLPNNIWWLVLIMKLSILQLSPFSVTSSLLGPNILLSTLFSDNLSLCSSLNTRDEVSDPYKTTGRIVIFYILTFRPLASRRENRRLWTEW
jgi:hypothetical protein